MNGSRLAGVDATRGLALLGMIAVHSLYDSDSHGNPTWTFAVFGGRSAAAFAVLAGIGISFMVGRSRVRLSDAKATAAALSVRALASGAIGIALGYTDAALGAIILPYFAVMFLLAIPLVFLHTWIVTLIGVIVGAGAPALMHVVNPGLAPPSQANPTLGYLLDHPIPFLTELTLNGEYPALPWMAYLCAGIAIGRLRLSKPQVALGLLALGATLAFTAPVASSILLHRYGGLAQIWMAQPQSVLTGPETAEVLTLGSDGTVPSSTWWWLAVASPHTSTPLDLAATTGSAIAVLAVMLLAAGVAQPVARLGIGLLLAPLAAAGAMTLTFYTAHMMFINSSYDNYGASTGYLIQAIMIVLIGLAWRATVGRGPLEGFVTSLANRARRRVSPQPMRPPRTAPRSTATSAATPGAR